MIQLNPKDASVLSRMAQYLELPLERRKQMLDETTTEDARRVGMVLLKKQLEENTSGEAHDLLEEWQAELAHVSPDVEETAEALRSWSEKSRYVTGHRSAAAGNSASNKI